MGKDTILLLVDLHDPSQLQQAVSGMEAADVAVWIPSLDADTLQKLHAALVSMDAPCRGVVSKMLAQRLAASLLTVGCAKSLWQLLQSCADDRTDSWVQAAACFLCAHLNRVDVFLPAIASEIVTEAAKFVHDQVSAIAFAKSFFKCDMGMSAFEQWPAKHTARIFLMLAWREARPEEKLKLLVKGHEIDNSHSLIREELAKWLQGHILRYGGSGSDVQSSIQGSVLKEALSKLTLEEKHLKQVSPQQLINLSQLLVCKADGARVAVFAAKAFAAMGKARDSEHAYLTAFEMDPSNREVAAGLARAVKSAHERFEETVRKVQGPRLEVGSSLVWDLSKYDFTKFTKDQVQRSETFQLPHGITAWLSLFPKGFSSKRMAAVDLQVDRPAIVQWTWQSGAGRVSTEERDFSKTTLHQDGKPDGWGHLHFLPISETNGSITLRLRSVQLPASTLRLS